MWTLSGALAGAALLVQACDREPTGPSATAVRSVTASAAAVLDPTINIAHVLDSFSIGGVYTVIPISGYPRNAQTIPFAPSIFVYTRSPEDTVYANPISRHPTGIDLPAGLPVRVLAQGLVVSAPTAVFLTGYCVRYSDPVCAVGSFGYSVHGLELGPGVLFPHLSGSGLRVHWSRGGSSAFGEYPFPQFFRGPVPATASATTSELFFSRAAGCCYRTPFGEAEYHAWERYEGAWQFGLVPDDGGRDEFGEPPLVRVNGPRTDAAMSSPATFTLSAPAGEVLTQIKWWFIEPANNVFNGVLPDSTVFDAGFNTFYPAYSRSRRTRIAELVACAEQTTCAYQAAARGSVVAQARLSTGPVYAAMNRGGNALPDEAAIECPTPVRRGDVIACEVRVLSGRAFRVTSIQTDVGSQVLTIPLTDPVVPAGQTYRLEGPAVTRSRVTASVEIDLGGGNSRTSSATSEFDVSARSFTVTVPVPTDSIVGAGDNPNLRAVFVDPYVLRDPELEVAMAATSHFEPPPSRFAVSYAATGPNAGLAMVQSAAPFRKAEVRVNKYAISGEWVSDQNGGSFVDRVTGDTVQYCGADLYRNVLFVRFMLHEGLPATRTLSHVRIYQEDLPVLASALEALHRKVPGSGSAIPIMQQQAVYEYEGWLSEYDSLNQFPFDQIDYPLVWRSGFTCRWDHNRFDP